MKEFNAETVRIETASALDAVQEAGKPKRYAAYVGLDVHKETIAVAIARPGRSTTSPLFTSSPRPRMCSPGRGWWCRVTRPDAASSCVFSTMTTASAPRGTGAPVAV